jgi:excisionase family DNA binding protein
MLSANQASKMIGVSVSLVYEWCAAGLLPHYRMGRAGKRGKILIEEAEFDQFLASCRREARANNPIQPLKHITLR